MNHPEKVSVYKILLSHILQTYVENLDECAYCPCYWRCYYKEDELPKDIYDLGRENLQHCCDNLIEILKDKNYATFSDVLTDLDDGDDNYDD